MPLPAGTKLGPHEILAAAGSGGMGEVYKARDTRLDRIVVIKVLPTHLADRSELRERFDREAKTIASLNHPHICVLYDIGQQDGIDYLVMEYLEGETLAQRLMKGPLPLDQVLRYAIEISDALDKAHRKGITHRDLKPGNVMLTKSGTKLLDFGLAKLKQEVAPAIPDSQLPTMKSAVTGEGTILGTLQYMAPEQVEAKEVDARTDIFAFGAVVYEMATGRKAFEGKTSASVMAKIMEAEPPSMASLQPMTPPALDRVVKKCLAKEPEKRWQAASDVCDELKWIAEVGSQAGLPAAVSLGRIRRFWPHTLSWGLAGVVLGAMISGAVVWNLKRFGTPPQSTARLAMVLPPNEKLEARGNAAVLSPDGSKILYVASNGSRSQFYLRSMDSSDAKPIAGTEEARSPFFSPDGKWIGLVANGKLKKVAVTGGTPLTLSDAPNFFGASWGPNDTIVFAPRFESGLRQVSASGGVVHPLTTPDQRRGEVGHQWPEFLPGGNAVLLTVALETAPTWDDSLIEVQLLNTGERRVLIQGGTNPHYLATGHLVYIHAGTVMAAPFDLNRLEVTGPAVPVIEGVAERSIGFGQFSVSRLGSLAYIPGTTEANQLVWIDRNGSSQTLPAPPRIYVQPRLSPDGRRIAVRIAQLNCDTMVYDIARESLTRLTLDGDNHSAIWTPDGKRITYASRKKDAYHLFWKPADGSGPEERLTKNEDNLGPTSTMAWSPDGKVLAFIEAGPQSGRGIWLLRADGDRMPQPLLQDAFNQGSPFFSPDGHWLGYVSDQSGRNEVYIQPFAGPGAKWQISTEGGTEPVWTRNGREIIYRAGNKMMAVEVTSQPAFTASKPKLIFETVSNYIDISAGADYDVSADGQRFVMVKEDEQAAPTQINVVLNWFEELKQKVPTGKK
ncbi:MAG TPA: protein kinase [Candidatus Acidoferrum sp.]|nr:protein kinase [Candidatus Acidoferrum sp.]